MLIFVQAPSWGRCKGGDFVEVKNATIDNGSKVSHLSYVGDAKVGKNVNIGAVRLQSTMMVIISPLPKLKMMHLSAVM